MAANSSMITKCIKVLEILEIVRREISVIKQPNFVFSLTPSHISLMVGMLQDTTATNGQVLSADCYARFEGKNDREKSILGIRLKKKYYLKGVLERRSSPSGHLWEEKKPDAMLKHLGLVNVSS